MENFECSICFETFHEPIECLTCHNNFCRKHFEGYKNECPICKTSPFKSTENLWLKNQIEKLEFIYRCSICDFKGDKNSFWSHLIDYHKDEIIQHYNKNEQSNQNYNNHINNSNLNKDMKKNNVKSFQNNQNNIKNDNNVEKNNNINNKYPNYNPNYFNNKNNNNNYNNNPYFNQEEIQGNVLNKRNIGNNISKSYILNQNNIQFPPPQTHRNIPNNVQKQKFEHAMPNQNNNKIPSLTDRKIYHCGKKNELINCDCCPDHICKEGNCLCVNCMKKNRQILKLRESELINKAGKIAKLFKGNYYCDKQYEAVIVNIIGKKFKKPSQCRYPSEPCEDCKSLIRFKDIYLK